MAVPCLTVVVPCYNEEATLADALKRVLESPYAAQVIVVDDGSTDGTRSRWRGASPTSGCSSSRSATIRGRAPPCGAGFTRATAAFVIVQDADLEYDPADYGGCS